jgi:hypothetical protein
MPHCILCYTYEATHNYSNSWVLDGLCEICKNMKESHLVLNIGSVSGKIIDNFNPNYVTDLQSIHPLMGIRQSREKYSIFNGWLPYCKKQKNCLEWGEHEMDVLCPSCGLINKCTTAILPNGGAPFHHQIIKAHKHSHIEDEWPEEHVKWTDELRFYFGLKDWNAFEAITPCAFREAMQYYKMGDMRLACAMFQECFIQSFLAHHGNKGGDDEGPFPQMYHRYSQHYAIYSLILASRCAKVNYPNIENRCVALLKIADHWARVFDIKDLIIMTTSELMRYSQGRLDFTANQTFDMEIKRLWIDESKSLTAKAYYYWRRYKISEYINDTKDVNYSMNMLKKVSKEAIEYAKSRDTIRDDIDIVGPSFYFFILEIAERLSHDIFIEDSNNSELREFYFEEFRDNSDPDLYQIIQIPLNMAVRTWDEADTTNVDVYADAYVNSSKNKWSLYMFLLARKLLMIRKKSPEKFAEYINIDLMKKECLGVGITDLEFD